jgi:hypothetical protein
MPIHWVTSAVVDRPIDEVWAALVDFFNAPRIGRREGLLAMRQTSPGPLGVGSTYTERRVILGFETRLTARITEWDPPHLVVSTMEGRPFRSFVSRFTLEAGPDGTKMVSSIDMELQPALKLLWPILGPFIRRRRRAAFGDVNAFLAILNARASGADAHTRT